MIYYCEGCGFLFRRIGEIRACPSYESSRLRSATEEEAKCLDVQLIQENKKGRG